jgi:quinol monooxygenase YgiN
VTYQFQCKEDRDEFFSQVVKIGAACRDEEGCLRYDYFLPADHDDEILLVEKWETEKALDAHGSYETAQRIGQIKNLFRIKTDVEKIVMND